jgi:hypothetical protein
MSHIVTIATEVRDPDAVAAACRRLGLPGTVQSSATLFSGRATGLLGRLPGLTYPVARDTATGTRRHANHGRAWRPQEQLDLLQAPAMERARLEAHRVADQAPADGSIVPVIQVGGVT